MDSSVFITTPPQKFVKRTQSDAFILRQWSNNNNITIFSGMPGLGTELSESTAGVAKTLEVGRPLGHGRYYFNHLFEHCICGQCYKSHNFMFRSRMLLFSREKIRLWRLSWRGGIWASGMWVHRFRRLRMQSIYFTSEQVSEIWELPRPSICHGNNLDFLDTLSWEAPMNSGMI